MQHRRFVNLVLDTFDGGRTAYALHRIDVSGLFIHRGGSSPAGATDEDNASLPPPAMTFHPTGSVSVGNVDFLPFTGSEGEDVVALGHDGHGLLYGAASRAAHVLPALHRHKGSVSPISLTAGGANDSLYVIERRPFYTDPCCFAVLSHGIRPGGWSRDDFPRHGMSPGWYWRSLPPPPFAYASYHECFTTCRPAARAEDYGIAACAASSGGARLWVTLAQSGGTYSFDTATGAWSEAAGDWALPFRGRAEYVPEHGLWFGLSSGWDWLVYLRAADLTGAMGRPRRVWEWDAGLAPPSEEWSPAGPGEVYLVPLGCGKFCVARFFEDDRGRHRCAVFTGVEVTKDGGGTSGGLRVLKHQSRRYNFLDKDFRRCLGRVF